MAGIASVASPAPSSVRRVAPALMIFIGFPSAFFV
jgi:hypothetical protein